MTRSIFMAPAYVTGLLLALIVCGCKKSSTTATLIPRQAAVAPPDAALPIDAPTDTSSAAEPPHLYDKECATCSNVRPHRCLYRSAVKPSHAFVGCGKAAPGGRYGVLVSEYGDEDVGTWAADFVWIDSELKVIRNDRSACTVDNAECTGPGTFLDVTDGTWVHEWGEPGQGAEENWVENFVDSRTFGLPIGEYRLYENQARTAVGFSSVVPNLGENSAESLVTLGCFDFVQYELHIVRKQQMPSDDADIFRGSVRWRGRHIQIVDDDEGKLVADFSCPPEATAPTSAP